MTPRAGAIDPCTWTPGRAAPTVSARLASWQAGKVPERVWHADPTLWPEAPASDVTERMGWLRLPESMQREIPNLLAFAESVRTEGIRHVVVLGMGGSSLAPDVFRGVMGDHPGYPELIILDSTHPAAVGSVAQRIDPLRTLFVVSSKSGTTTEPLAFSRYFWELLRAAGTSPGPHFVAVTDPGSPLETLAVQQQFRAVFRALSTVGGRYSALTMFGLVPAALTGTDIAGLIDQARTMAEACAPSVPATENPGLSLGAILGELARGGRDKLTFYASGTFAPFPPWIEQLVAESTGKIGKGLVPIVDEPFAAVGHYGSDRLFVEIQPISGEDPALSAHTDQLAAVGHPVVRIRLSEPSDLGQEFFRWELGVASAGMILGINPFDQPDVEFAKELARKAMAHPTDPGAPGGPPTVLGDESAQLATAVRDWSARCRPGDYIGIQAYLAPSAATWELLQEVRRRLLDRWKVATTLGYGPRFLHSTGQLHKGGPNTGLFLQIVDRPSTDLEVPGLRYTFGQLIHAQALGDSQALQHHQRRLLRVDLGGDVAGGLRRLAEAVDA